MLNNVSLLLEDAAAPAGNGWSQYVLLGVLVVFFVGMMIFSSRSQKKRQKKVKDMIDALKVGDKIKTIGGFIGTIVEVCDDNAFIIETGSKEFKSFMKIDKSAIYASGEGSQQATEKAASTTAQPKEEYDEVVKDEDTKEEK